MVFKKGNIPWNKEKTPSKETIKQLEPTMFKKGHIPWCAGKHHSEESKKKMSLAKVGKHAGESHPMFGKHHSEESKQKMSESHRGKPSGNLGKPCSEEAKKKISESLKGKQVGDKNPFYGKKPSKRVLKILKESASKLWKTEWYVKKQMISRQVRPNGAELFLDSILQNHFPDEWKYVGDGELIISGLCPDFVNCNGRKKIIELFGEYWHSKKGKIKPTGTEEVRTKIFKELGYDTLFIWEGELVDEEKLIEKIRLFSE